MIRVRVTTPVVDFTGTVGEYAFAKGVFEGEVSDGALTYFRTAGYGVEEVDTEHSPTDPDDDPDGPGGLPPKSGLRDAWEQAGIDLGLTEDAVKGASNKDQLIELVTAARDAKTANPDGASE